MKLHRGEARLVAELARTPGRVVAVDVLVDAINGWRASDRATRKLLAAYVSGVRAKFGAGVIETVKDGRWTVGYMLREAL